MTNRQQPNQTETQSHHPMLRGAALLAKQSWYVDPLVISVSLVYGATRHELWQPIL
jgi:hypothetical protein